MNADASPRLIDLSREPPFRLGAADVRPATCEVILGDRREVLQPRVMQVLVALAQSHQEVVSRDELIQTCWGGRIVGDDAIDRCIAQIRLLAKRLGGFGVETIPRVGFRLAGSSPGAARTRGWSRAALAAGVTLALVLLLALGAWLTRTPGADQSGKTLLVVSAVRPLGADPAVQHFAQSLGDRLPGGLGGSGVESAPRGQLADRRADFVVQGLIEGDGPSLRVNLHLTDGRTNTSLWSASISGLAGAQDDLRERATAAVAMTVKCAAMARAPRAGPIGLSNLQQFLRACSMIDDPDATQSILTLLRQVNIEAPRFEPAFAFLAVFAAEADREVDPVLAPPLRAESTAAAKRALALAPNEGLAYMALEMDLQPRSNWAERQRLLSRGLTLDPDNFALVGRQGLVLVGQGRLKEAEIFQRQATTLNPASAIPVAELADSLAASGANEQAQQVIDSAYRLWPQNSHLAGVRFAIAALNGRGDQAIAMLDDAKFGPVFGTAAERAAWRQAVQAMSSPPSSGLRTKAVEALRDAVRDHAVWAPEGVQGLSALGDVDDALRVAEDFSTRHPDYEPTYLFRSGTDAMRRDPRFMKLAHRLGLTDYWRAQNRWPDFCSDPTLPYSCQAEAARISG